MCKILTLTNAAKVTDKLKLITTAHKLLKSQRDGFGFAFQAPDYKLWGERTADVEKYQPFSTPLDLPFLVKSTSNFGTPTTEVRGFMAHGRIATCNKHVRNVHPIVNDRMAIIHNGVVTNNITAENPSYEMKTENDSEHILHHLSKDNGGIDSLAAHLTGYYAAVALDSVTGDIIILRDSIAKLYCAYIGTIESYIYATTEELIQELCSTMAWEYSVIAAVKDDTYVRHAVDGEIFWRGFKSRGRDSYAVSKSQLSLGYQLSDYTPTVTSKAAAVVEAPKATKKEAKALRATQEADLIGECIIPREKASLKKFFAQVKSNKSLKFYSMRGVEISRADFLEYDPEDQLGVEVIAPDGSCIDPFWSDSVQPTGLKSGETVKPVTNLAMLAAEATQAEEAWNFAEDELSMVRAFQIASM